MNTNLIENEDFQTVISAENGIFTVRTLNTESNTNDKLLEDFQVVDTLPIINVSSNSCFNLLNLPKITNLDDLLKYLCELMIRFDSNPTNYQKGDYEHLIKTIVNSLIYLYTPNDNNSLFSVGNCDAEDGSNGTELINSSVKIISAFNDHLEFVNSPYEISNIEGNVVLKLSDTFINSITDYLKKNIIFGIYIDDTHFQVNEIDILLESEIIYIDIITKIQYIYINNKLEPINSQLFLDESLQGDGTQYNPLAVSDAFKTTVGNLAELIQDETTARSDADAEFTQYITDLSTRLSAIDTWKESLTDADSDNIVNTLTELLALVQNVPEGVDLIALLNAKVSTTDIIDNLTSILTNKPLSAYQGKVLKDLIDSLQTQVNGISPTVSHDTTLQGNGTTQSPLGLSETGLNTLDKYFVSASQKTQIGVNAGDIVTIKNTLANYNDIQKPVKQFTNTIMNIEKNYSQYKMDISQNSTITFDTTLMESANKWQFDVLFNVTNFVSIAFPPSVYFYGGNQMIDIGTYSYRFESYDNGLTWAAKLNWKKIAYVSNTGKKIFVKTSADGGNDGNNGLTWSTAKATYEGAQAIAITGDIIMMKSGTYLPTQYLVAGVERSRSNIIKNGVNVYGGFQGTESNPDERIMTTETVTLDLPYGIYQFDIKTPTNETIFSGQLTGSAIAQSVTYGCRYTSASIQNNSYCLIYFNGSSNTILDGIVLEKSYSDNSAYSTIHVTNQVLRLTNIKARDCYTSTSLVKSIITNNSIFEYCTTQSFAGTILDSIIIDSRINNLVGANGGTTLSNSTLNHCKIYAYSYLQIINGNVYNTVFDSCPSFVSIYQTIINCLFSNMYNNYAPLSVTSSAKLICVKIINCRSTGASEAVVYVLSSDVYAANILIAHCSSTEAALVVSPTLTPTLINFSVIKNLGVTHAGVKDANLINSVVWGNRIDGIVSNWYDSTGTHTPSYTAFEALTVPGTSNYNISTNNTGDATSPNFVTVEVTTGNTSNPFDYDIAAGSYLIDKGNNAYPNNGDGSLYDNKGRTRKVGTVDLGCYEKQ